MTAGRTTVLLADDQDLIRDALRALLLVEPAIDVVGQARNGLEAVQEAVRLRPDVILMDVRMPVLSGPEAASQIKRTRGLGRTRILILTTFEEESVIRACLDAGADGFIGKGSSTAALIDAIHAVRRGEAPLSPRAARYLLNPSTASSSEERGGARFSELTTRELDVVRLVALGISDAEIGRRLSISPATVKTHVRNAMRKLDVHGRAQLVALVHRAGLGA